MQLDSSLNGRWVLAIEGSDAQVDDILLQLGGTNLLQPGQISLVIMERERSEADELATLTIGHQAGSRELCPGVAIVDVFRMRALTPSDDANRRAMLRARNEFFCATADVVVICGAEPGVVVDPAHYTVRMALARVKPVIWIEETQVGEVVWRLSGVPSPIGEDDNARPDAIKPFENYASIVEQLLHLRDTDRITRWRSELGRVFSIGGPAPSSRVEGDRALEEWWRFRVEPVLDPRRAASSERASALNVHAVHTSGTHNDGQAPSPHTTIGRISLLELNREGFGRWWWARAVAFWGKSHGSGSWFATGECERPGHDGKRADGPFHDPVLRSCPVIGNIFHVADDRARVDSGRYRGAIWLGYLLSIFAVLSATSGAIAFEHAENATVTHLQYWTGTAWALSLILLSVISMQWRRLSNVWRHLVTLRKSTTPGPTSMDAGVLRICFSILVLAIPCALALGLWRALPVSAIAEIAALSTIMALVCLVWTLNAHERWIAARALAEAVRHDQILSPGLVLSRVSRQASFRIERNGLELSDGLAWWQARIRAFQPLPRLESAEASEISLADRRYLSGYVHRLLALIASQVEYHSGRSKRQHRLHHLIHTISGALFALAVASTLAHVMHIGHEPWAQVWTFLTIALPVTAAGLHAINAQLEAGRHAAASDSMLAALQSPHEQLVELEKELLERAGDSTTVPWSQVAQVRRLAATVADAMMGEVADWFRLVAAQPMTVPA